MSLPATKHCHTVVESLKLRREVDTLGVGDNFQADIVLLLRFRDSDSINDSSDMAAFDSDMVALILVCDAVRERAIETDVVLVFDDKRLQY